MYKLHNKVHFLYSLLMFVLFIVISGLNNNLMAATITIRDSQQEDAYTDNALAAGYAYPVDSTYRLSYTNNLCAGTILVNYVGGNVSNFGLNYQRAAVKFDISAISGTITSATFKIYVVDANNSPVVNLISTTDNSWTQTNQLFPSYNSANIINGYSNSSVSANSWKSFDVTNYLQSVVDAVNSSVSFVLTGTEGGDQFFNFVSNLETTQSSWRPVLSITYTPLATSPSVTGTALTNNPKHTWSWVAGGGGNGTYRYKLDDSDLSTGATTTTSLSFTSVSALSEGSHTLYVQESNGATPERWSNSGSFTTIVDTTSPNAPTVSGTTPTSSTTPTWTWTTGGNGGNGTCRYKLDDSNLSSGATTTTSTSYTPGSALSAGSHILYVQERDAAGNWSISGNFTIVIDTSASNAPIVTGTTPTNDATPTWNWTAGGGGNGTFRYKLNDSDLISGATTTTLTSYTPDSALSAGSHTLYVQEQNNVGNWSSSGSFTIVIDATPPTAPTVTGTTPTNDTTPTWSWTAGGGGNGTFRYKLDDSNLASGATITTLMSYTPGSALNAASHTLYVQEQDTAGNWSTSGSYAIVIDTTPPAAPTVTGTTPTSDTTPTWSWTAGGGGNGTFRYKLDDSNLASGATITTLMSYTPGSALNAASHTLYVQEQDTAGNWSTSGSYAIVIDTTPPTAPTVTGTTPTNDITPTWSWTAGGGGNGTFRYKLDDSNLASGAITTTSTNCTSGSNLSEGSHTLYVQEQDVAGNWSASGSFSIVIDTTPPTAPTVTGTKPTNDTTPTWSWTAGGGGNGTFRYKLDNSDLTSGATTTITTSYKHGSSLSEGNHTLYVQERDSAGNWSSNGSFTIAIDTTSPAVSSLSPVNGASNIGVIDNLIITFNEQVMVGTGNVVIIKTSDNSIVETIAVTSGKITGSGTNTITINPATVLLGSTGYYVNIDDTAFDDLAGNSYVGISSKTTWAFTTEIPEPPIITFIKPLDGSTVNISTGSTIIVNITNNGMGINTSSVKLQVDGGSWVNPTALVATSQGYTLYYLITNINFSTAPHNVTVKFNDLADISYSKTVSFYMDARRNGFGFGRLRFD